MRFSNKPFLGVAPFAVFALGSCVGVAVGQPANCGATKEVPQTASGLSSTAVASAGQISSEQQAQVSAIFQQLLSGVEGLRSDAQTQIRAVLTPEQRAQFDTQGIQNWPTAQSFQANGPAATPGATGAAVGTGPTGTMEGHSGNPPSFSGQTQQVSLTDTQRVAIHEIMGSLHATDRVLHDQAQTAFRAVLMPSQAAVLDQLKGQQSVSIAAPASGNQTGATGSTNDPLQLSADQQSQAAAILSQLQLDRQALHAAGRQQIMALLTPQQNAQAEAMNSTSQAVPNGTPPSAGTTPIGGANDTSDDYDRGHEPSSRSTSGTPLFDAFEQLNLTAYQGSSIANIFGNLRNALESQVQQAVASSRGITAPVQGATSGTIGAQPTAGR